MEHVALLKDIYSYKFLKWRNLHSVYIRVFFLSLSLSVAVSASLALSLKPYGWWVNSKLVIFLVNENLCTIFLFKMFMSRVDIESRSPFDVKSLEILTYATAWQSQKRVNKLPRQYLLCPLDLYALLVSKVTEKRNGTLGLPRRHPSPVNSSCSNSDKWYLLHQD